MPPTQRRARTTDVRGYLGSSQILSGSSSESNSQSTIPELFATTKADCASDLSNVASPSKRRKTEHSSDVTGNMASAQTLRPEQMYSFPPTRCGGEPDGHASNPIKIGDSPVLSPVNSTLNRTRPQQVSSKSGPKKLVVKNFKSTSKFDSKQYIEDVWSRLDTSLSAIFAGNEVRYPKEELYKGVENTCRQGGAATLYERLRAKCETYLASQIQKLAAVAHSSQSDVDVLQATLQRLSIWTQQMETIRPILFYLDRTFLLPCPDHKPLDEFTVELYKRQVISQAQVVERAVLGACQLSSSKRGGFIDDESLHLLQSAIKMFIALNLYVSHFEPEYLKQTLEHYNEWSANSAVVGGLGIYAKGCQDCFSQESNQCEVLGLETQTWWALQEGLEECLILTLQQYLLDKNELAYLLGQNDVESLTHLFSLLQRKSLGTQLRPVFEEYIIDTGSDIIFDEAREGDMVIRLLDFKRKLDRVWEISFQKNEDVGHTLREAFENFINKTKRSNMTWGTDNSKPGEMIAKYVDTILKGGLKSIISASAALDQNIKIAGDDEDADQSDVDEDTEIEKQLDNVLNLFRFVHGKAVFEAFYKRDLARRLLLARSASADAEKGMMSRLRNECGAGFTHNLEQMFKDMELAREEVTSYRQMLEEREVKPSVDLNVSVLSAAAWPSYPDFAIEIPQAVRDAVTRFESFYKLKHGNRRLVWKHSLAHCQIKAGFPRGKHEIVVSAFQAIVLLLFNGRPIGESVAYSDIQGATNLEDKELKRTLQSLACAKYRVLSKTPKGKDVNASDTFTVNANFSDPKYRIKINQVQAKETKEENIKVHTDVVADRNYETQAAIVRIMKSRKSISHVQLISEVISATKSRGVLDPADIKKNIEKLIDKDYMERDEIDLSGKTYTYVA